MDKGFARTSRYYLYVNFTYVPAFIRSDSKDLSGADLKEASINNRQTGVGVGGGGGGADGG